MSKGSRQRPTQVSNEEYANRWDAIFGIHKDEKPDETAEAEEKEEETDDNS